MVRHSVDLTAVEADYRAGLLSLRAIATKYGCSEAAIRKWAKKAVDAKGQPAPWARDLAPHVRARADAILACNPGKSASHVRAAVRTTHATTCVVRTLDAHAQAAAIAIETGARAIVQVIHEHRRALSRAGQMAAALMQQLEEEIAVQQLRARPAGTARCVDRVALITGRAAALRHLLGSLQLLVTLERQVYGVDQQHGHPGAGVAQPDAEAIRATFDAIRQRAAAAVAACGPHQVSGTVTDGAAG